MTETHEIPRATVPDQPESSSPINKSKPLIILLFVILIIFVVSSAVTATKKTAPLKSQLTAKPATASPQQVSSFQTQQEQTAKKDQDEQQQRAQTTALLAALQGPDSPGPASGNAPPMTAAQRAAIYGVANANAPQATSQISERQAQAKQAELAREKQQQDALNSDTVAVDFSRPVSDASPAAVRPVSPGPIAASETPHDQKVDASSMEDRKPSSKDVALNKYDFDSYDGKLFRTFEGTVFEGVVTNHIDGGLAGPILIMLTTDYYSHDHQELLLPQGTRLIGSVQAVNSSQARKMVVAFHRAICPDGFSVDLDKFAGLDPLGTTGLATKVDNRYFQTFAVAAAIGGLGGLAQIGNNNVLDPSAQIRNGVTSQTSQEGEQILNHFLNRLPIITLKEGSRARVYIGRDILVPSYAEHRVQPTL
jgi:type IV secretory pathway VirB10-like protein